MPTTIVCPATWWWWWWSLIFRRPHPHTKFIPAAQATDYTDHSAPIENDHQRWQWIWLHHRTSSPLSISPNPSFEESCPGMLYYIKMSCKLCWWSGILYFKFPVYFNFPFAKIKCECISQNKVFVGPTPRCLARPDQTKRRATIEPVRISAGWTIKINKLHPNIYCLAVQRKQHILFFLSPSCGTVRLGVTGKWFQI